MSRISCVENTGEYNFRESSDEYQYSPIHGLRQSRARVRSHDVGRDRGGGRFFTIKDGQLQRSTGYREWVYVGTPLTPNDLNSGKAAYPEFHNVYIDPLSWVHWKTTGQFREGTIIMKELVGVGSKVAVSGNGYFQGDFVGLEATIKSKQLFPDEPDGWEATWFDRGELAATSAARPFVTVDIDLADVDEAKKTYP